MKIKNINLDLIKKLPWIIQQPLSQKPENSKSTISDLFVWIKNKDIQTEYEILDLPNLFNKEIKKIKSKITLFIFDKNGKEILKKNILKLAPLLQIEVMLNILLIVWIFINMFMVILMLYLLMGSTIKI